MHITGSADEDQELKGNNGQISFSLLDFHNVLNTMFPLSASFFIHWLTKSISAKDYQS